MRPLVVSPFVASLPFLLFLASSCLAQDMPGEVALTPTDDQNYLADASGELRIEGGEARYDIILPADILFDFDEAELRPDAQPLLDQLREHFATHEADQVHVRGNTDSKGSDEYNLTLSLNRAAAVCDWLKASAEIDVTNCIGQGEMDPLVPNENADGSDNPENRQRNRRVTINVVVYPDTDAMMNEAQSEANAALDGLGDANTDAMLDAAEAEAGAALEGLPDRVGD